MAVGGSAFAGAFGGSGSYDLGDQSTSGGGHTNFDGGGPTINAGAGSGGSTMMMVAGLALVGVVALVMMRGR